MIVASTPGKLILVGEHAVVHGQPALVTTVNRRLTVRLSPTSADDEIELHLPQIGVLTRETWTSVRDYTARARERWQRYRAAPSALGFAEVRGSDRAHLVKVALGEADAFLAARGPLPESRAILSRSNETRGLRLAVESELPIGSGFGSSAALATAVLAAVLTARLAERNDAPKASGLERAGLQTAALTRWIEPLALEVERQQHGTPSGVDGAAVLHGGAVWAESDAKGRRLITPLAPHPRALDALARFRVFDTGMPIESTGEVVAAVRERLERNTGLRRTIEEIGALTRRFRTELEAPAPALDTLLALVRDTEARLETLGVVPRAVRELVREIEAEGGAAKISGAGALTSPPDGPDGPGLGAGSLLVLHPRPERIRSWPCLQNLEPLDLRLGAPGLKVELRD